MPYDDEPVFKRSNWGTNRYYYNPNNPIGLALIIITVVFVGTMMLLMANHAGPFKPDPPKTWNPPAYDQQWQPPSNTPAGP